MLIAPLPDARQHFLCCIYESFKYQILNMAAVDRKAFSRILVEVFAHYTAFVRDGRPFFALWTIQLFSVIEMKLSINE